MLTAFGDDDQSACFMYRRRTPPSGARAVQGGAWGGLGACSGALTPLDALRSRKASIMRRSLPIAGFIAVHARRKPKHGVAIARAFRVAHIGHIGRTRFDNAGQRRAFQDRAFGLKVAVAIRLGIEAEGEAAPVKLGDVRALAFFVGNVRPTK